MNTEYRNVSASVNAALGSVSLGKGQVRYLLNIQNDDSLDLLGNAARKLREKYFGRGIFLYGFLYFSTHCRNNCRFCNYRRANTNMERYRKGLKEIVCSAKRLTESGVHLIDLTMGEDPMLIDSDFGSEHLVNMVRRVLAETRLPLMISPGAISDSILVALARAGADWFACYQEAHSRRLFNRLRPGQSFDERMAKKMLARKQGLLVEEGLLTGVGESLDDLAESIIQMKIMDVDQARVMSFVPAKDIPIQSAGNFDSRVESIVISVLRLVFPDRLIPASLDVEGLDGLSLRLDAGANVITSIVPPGEMKPRTLSINSDWG